MIEWCFEKHIKKFMQGKLKVECLWVVKEV